MKTTIINDDYTSVRTYDILEALSNILGGSMNTDDIESDCNCDCGGEHHKGHCGGNCKNHLDTTKKHKKGKLPNSQRRGMSSASMNFPKPIRVMFNAPTTTLFFDDGTITKVKAMEGDKFDKEHGILYAFFKRLMGRNGKRDGMYGLMPSSGATEYIRELVKNATDIGGNKPSTDKPKTKQQVDKKTAKSKVKARGKAG